MNTSPDKSAPADASRAQSLNKGTVTAIIISAIALGVSSYAWFAQNRTVSVQSVADVSVQIRALESKFATLQRQLDAQGALATPLPNATGSVAAAARSPASAAAEHQAPAASTTSASPPASPAETSGAFAIVANADLKGRLGRLTIAFPDNANVGDARTLVYKAGEKQAIENRYGSAMFELLPGTYDLTISKRRITGVVVKSRHDTRMQVGVLRVQGDTKTRFLIFEPGGKEAIENSYGSHDFGLPVGEYEVMLSGQRAPATVTNGQITQF